MTHRISPSIATSSAPNVADALGLGPRESVAMLRAIGAIVEVSVEPEEQRRFLDLCAAMLGVLDIPAPALSAAELSAAFPGPVERRGVVHTLLVAACLGGSVSAEAEARIRALAAELGTRTHWVDLLGPLRKKSVFTIKRALMQRAPDGRRVLTRTWEEEGIRGVGRALLFVAGLHRDKALAQRFCDLEALPEGSFGRSFFHHIRSRGLAFPGEQGGVPERMVHHDLMHVLTGYDTDGPGECELAGFYAGLGVGDSFTFIVIALATFQLGLAVSPAAVTPTVGAFDAERVARAYLRGRQVRVDVMGPWDYWRLMPLPLAEARQALGIRPT